jgi:hypothetical protein
MFRISVFCQMLKFVESVRGHDIQRAGLGDVEAFENRQPEPQLIANKKIGIYSSASMAAKPRLVAIRGRNLIGIQTGLQLM